MGLDTNGIKFLLSSKNKGVSFSNTLMVGRQILNLDFREFKENLQGFSLYKSEEQVDKFLTASGGYAEDFLRYLGAEKIDSLDYSAYEGANILHDMNLAVPENLKGKYSLVLESGSLEHIFNFPRSMANCMEMVEEGGHLLIITPVNNIMGHGFYQFSPEIFYRILNEANGFLIEQMLIFEYSPEEKWYQVEDPKKVRCRVELMNSSATYLCLRARRLKEMPVLERFPYQSDYEDAWEGRENYYSKIARDRDSVDAGYSISGSRKFLKKLIPGALLDVYRAYKQARKVKFNPEFYREIDIWKA
jgi:hypothetical protein